MSPIVRLAAVVALICAPTATLGLALGATTKLFGVCAATTVTNSGFTVINGALGLSPGTSVTGFPPGTATSIEIGTPSAIACESQAAITYQSCRSQTTTKDLSGTPLAPLTLGPGVYNFATTATLNGILTLDAGGNANAQFIFKIGTSFSTSANSKVNLINGAKACNVFWCVGSSATIGATNTFNGPLIAYTSVAVGISTTDVGGFFALNGAVTLLTNSIVKSGTC